MSLLLCHLPNFTKNCPLLQETPTSTRNAHFIKNCLLPQKTTFFDKVPLFWWSGIYWYILYVFSCRPWRICPFLSKLGTLTKSTHFFKKSPLLWEKPTSSKKAHFIKNHPLHQEPAEDFKKTMTRCHIYTCTRITLHCISILLVVMFPVILELTNHSVYCVQYDTVPRQHFYK